MLKVLLILAGSAWIWMGIAWGWGKLLITSLACVVAVYGVLVVFAVADFPTALLCERGRTEIQTTPTSHGGHFTERHIGPCVLFNPEGGD